MRERSQTTPRRRGPKLPLPTCRRDNYEENFEVSESPYYTIDNTEDIYGTTLSPTQRSNIDPWDLENYDYVRKKLNSTPMCSSPDPFNDTSLSARPYYILRSPPSDLQLVSQQPLAATMPRNIRGSQRHEPCQLDCCSGVSHASMIRHRRYEDTTSKLYGMGPGKYDDYTSHMTMNIETEEDTYTGYDGISSSSSTELHSSIDENIKASTMILNRYSGYEITTGKTFGPSYDKPLPQLEFPLPPSQPPPTPNSNQYAYLPYCTVSDCYDCSMIYATSLSIYGGINDNRDEDYKESTIYGSSMGRRTPSSLYSGLYGNKFGLSKKGLLQIDYSCSWNDLNRIMGR